MEEHPEKPTILDVLNEDCWRVILNYLSTKDLVRSERVSRQWQSVVFLYLQGVRFAVRYSWRWAERRRANCRVLMVNASTEPVWFQRVLDKWGPSVVTIAYDYNPFRSTEAILSGLAKKCPSLENISTSDCCVSKLLKNNAIEELGIDMTYEVTGSCLSGDVNLTRLHSLYLRECGLEIDHLLFAVDRMTAVTKLELLHLTDEVYERLHLLVDRMPQLTHLTLVWEEEIYLLGDELVASIGRLRRLTRLDLCLNPNVTDDWLAILARGCRELRSLSLNNCKRVTPDGVVSFCRATPVLEELCVASHIRITDAYALAFVKACPTLTTLDLRDCRQVSGRVLAAAARGRSAPGPAPSAGAAPLRLRLAGTAAAGHERRQTQYTGLILDFS